MMNGFRSCSFAVTGMLAAMLNSGHMQAGETPAVKAPVASAMTPDVSSYCQSLIPVMADSRSAAEQAQLQQLRVEIAQKLTELEARKAEVEDWVNKRNAILKQADAGRIAIYANMRPDAAAAQLADMDEATGAAIIAKLPARNASAILSEMDAERAAKLTAAMGGNSASEKKL